MPAPEGNKNALGNEGGRPRLKFDPATEMQELLKWAMTDDALVLRMFPATRGYSHDTMQRWCEGNVEFCDIYNMAKELIGARRELLLIKNNSATPFQRYASYYDQALHLFERKDKEKDSELKKIENSKINSGNVTVNVSGDGLGSGLNVSTSPISTKSDKGSQ